MLPFGMARARRREAMKATERASENYLNNIGNKEKITIGKKEITLEEKSKRELNYAEDREKKINKILKKKKEPYQRAAKTLSSFSQFGIRSRTGPAKGVYRSPFMR